MVSDFALILSLQVPQAPLRPPTLLLPWLHLRPIRPPPPPPRARRSLSLRPSRPRPPRESFNRRVPVDRSMRWPSCVFAAYEASVPVNPRRNATTLILYVSALFPTFAEAFAGCHHCIIHPVRAFRRRAYDTECTSRGITRHVEQPDEMAALCLVACMATGAVSISVQPDGYAVEGRFRVSGPVVIQDNVSAVDVGATLKQLASQLESAEPAVSAMNFSQR